MDNKILNNVVSQNFPVPEIQLKCENVWKKFGGFEALKGIDMDVKEGEILGLIGPNGAGKSTLLNLINGIYPPTEGKITFRGAEISGRKPHEICRLGISRVFQIPKPFYEMSCVENVITAIVFNSDVDLPDAEEKAFKLLEFVGMRYPERRPDEVTLQDKRRVELARALACEPKLLLVDEYMAGLNPSEVGKAVELLRKVNKELGITLMWVEHVMPAIMGLAERVVVLDHGVKIAEGTPEEVVRIKEVIEAYLGTDTAVEA